MVDAFAWWLTVEVVGLAALPLTALLLHRLPDRGFAFARPVGLLVVGYGVWIAATLRLLPNGRGSAILLLVGLGVLGLVLVARRQEEWTDLVRTRWRALLGVEVIFLAAFALMAVIRAFNAEIAGTEKPMDLAFVNAILRSDFFPPHDPWLAGHSISYYYFGHTIVATLVALSGVPSAVGFNLALATFFGLAVTGAYALGSALVSPAAVPAGALEPAEPPPPARTPALAAARPSGEPAGSPKRPTGRRGSAVTWHGPDALTPGPSPAHGRGG
ncbi:MAG: hypothetical protein HY331_03235, partial [Chloroflexi bacterium]|nr:hypothetical protein [Chloroflexota bacterium]